MATEHVIDLGEEISLKIKYAGKEYSLREPTVEEIDKFRSQELQENATVSILVDFLSGLGMPAEVVKSMGMSKARALVDGLMDFITKKK